MTCTCSFALRCNLCSVVNCFLTQSFCELNKLYFISLQSQDELDIFKDTSLRFLGYTNEVGEAFRSLIPRPLVNATYAIAAAYALSDSVHKGHATYNVYLVVGLLWVTDLW